MIDGMTAPLEQDILPAVLVAVTALPATMAWRANSGLLRAPNSERRVRANIPGCADILGCRAVIITPDMVGQTIGQAMAIETKRQQGRPEPSQVNFERQWRLAGGLYIIARSADDAVAALS